MSEQVYEQLTLFPEDFLASRSPLPGNTEARKMTVTSGRKCLELYQSYSQLGLLVRTCLESSIWHSTRCFLLWKPKVTKSGRLLFQLAASTHGIKESESALWPTILANGMGSSGHQKMLSHLVEIGHLTDKERRGMICGNGGTINPTWAEWFQGYAKNWTGLIPTPKASDWKGAPKSRFIGGGTDISLRN